MFFQRFLGGIHHRLGEVLGFNQFFFTRSWSAYASASLAISHFFLLASGVSIRMLCSLLLALSLALTFKIPLASISKLTSTCGIPRGAGGTPFKQTYRGICYPRHFPFALQNMNSTELVIGRGTKDLALEVGIVVLRAINGVRTPPKVSNLTLMASHPVTRASFTSPCMTPAWIAHQWRASSGLTPACGSLPKNSFTLRITTACGSSTY